MSDIFLSYAREDRERAAELASTLKACGWDVWWDRALLPGDRFSPVIAEQLATTRCLVVLWSQSSVASDWVADEANEAKKRGIYLPVLLDGTEPPLGFRAEQYGDLSSWNGSFEDQDFQRLLGGIRRHAGPGGTPPLLNFWQRVVGKIGRILRNTLARLAIAAVPAAALAGSMILMARSPVSAQIRLALKVSQATLTFKEAVDKGVLSTFLTSALTVVDFGNAELGFAALQSSQVKIGPGQVRLSAADPQASVTFNDVQCEGVRLPPGSPVTLGWRDGSLHLTAKDTPLAVSFSTRKRRLSMTCDGCAVAGGDQMPARLLASTSYTFVYSSSQIVTIESQLPGMGLTLDAPVGAVLTEGNILLDGAEFTDADDSGRGRKTSILSGQVDYLELSRTPRQLNSDDFVVVGSLESFYLTRVVVDAEGLTLEAHGQVGQLDVGGAGNIRSQLPSRLEEIMSRSSWMVYAGATVAAGALAAGVFGLGRRRSRV